MGIGDILSPQEVRFVFAVCLQFVPPKARIVFHDFTGVHRTGCKVHVTLQSRLWDFSFTYVHILHAEKISCGDNAE